MVEKLQLIVASTTQTGDIAHIAGALALLPQANALITCDILESIPENAKAIADLKLLKDFYSHAADNSKSVRKNRVEFLPIASHVQKEFFLELKRCQNLLKPTPKQMAVFENALGAGHEYTDFKVCK
jgi:hypothetical protein